MAAESERITSLFSVYNDDEDDDDELTNPSPSPKSPLQSENPSSPKTLTPQNGQKSSLNIVDYAHDEMAVSPDRLDGRTKDLGDTIASENLESLEISKTDFNNSIDFEMGEASQAEEIGVICTNSEKDDDLLINFLGPPVTTKCPENLQQRINLFIALKKSGKSFNADLRNKKNYRNPDFLQHAVRYQGIDQIGSCFSKDIFDPHGYDKSDFYDEIEGEMKREIERKELERKRSPKVDFVSGGQQPVPIVPVLKTSSLPSSAPGEGRQKKSKWDKVE